MQAREWRSLVSKETARVIEQTLDECVPLWVNRLVKKYHQDKESMLVIPLPTLDNLERCSASHSTSYSSEHAAAAFAKAAALAVKLAFAKKTDLWPSEFSVKCSYFDSLANRSSSIEVSFHK